MKLSPSYGHNEFLFSLHMKQMAHHEALFLFFWRQKNDNPNNSCAGI